MAGFYPAFETVLIDANGVRSIAASITIICYNETTSASLGTISSNSSGKVAHGSFGGASAGDVVKFSHGTYPGVFRMTMQADINAAYNAFETDTCAFVLRNLRAATVSEVVRIFGKDQSSDAAHREIGAGAAGTTIRIPYQSAIDQTVELIPVSHTKKQTAQASPGLDPDLAMTVNVPGSSPTPASTTEVLSGSNTVKYVTPDSLAALWEQGHQIIAAGTISIDEGGYFEVIAFSTVTITDIDFATDWAGREVKLRFKDPVTLQHNAATLPLLTGADIVTAAGDIGTFRSEGSDVVRMVGYERKDGTALTSGAAAASKAEVLAATNAVKYVTPDALSALWVKGHQIIAASTILVGDGGEGGYFEIIAFGAVTITDIDFVTDQPGREVDLYFKDPGITLQHNATTLPLFTAADIVTAPGDIARFRSEGSDVVRMVGYERKDGTALVGGAALASTTEVLTGTDTAKVATPDALAALWEKGSNIASAATISVGEGGYFHVTGTTTITDIDPATDKAGREFTLVFDSALILTYNATTLILPTSASITTVAGDIATFVSEGSDVVRCIKYQRSDGTVLAPTPSAVNSTSSATTTLTTAHSGETYELTNTDIPTVVLPYSGILGGITNYWLVSRNSNFVLKGNSPGTGAYIIYYPTFNRTNGIWGADDTDGTTPHIPRNQLVHVRHHAPTEWQISGGPALVDKVQFDGIWAAYESTWWNQGDSTNIGTDWGDATGNGRNAARVGTPVFLLDQINGLPGISIASGSGFNPPSMSGFSSGMVIQVWKVTSVSTSGASSFGTSGQQNKYPDSGATSTILTDTGSPTRRSVTSGITILNTWHILYEYSATNNWGIEQNWSSLSTDSTNTVGFQSSPHIGISNFGTGVTGILGGVYIFNSVTALGLAQFKNYARAKYLLG